MKLVFRVTLVVLLCIARPASAGDGQRSIAGGGSMPEPAAIVCFDPASGEQEEISLKDNASGHCPQGQVAFLRYEPEQSPGALPLYFTPRDQEKQDGVADALSDRQ